MKNKFLLLVLFVVLIPGNVLSQDSLIRIEPVFFLFYYHAKEAKSINEKEKSENFYLYPGIIITFPLAKKFSLSSGLLISNKILNKEYDDSTLAVNDPTIPVLQKTYYRSINRDETKIIIPLYINYNLYSKKVFYWNTSVGINFPIFNMLYNEKNFYSSNSSINYTKGILLFENLELTINTTLTYFLCKHIGVYAKPFISYDIIERKNTFACGLGIGICYK